MQSRKITSIVLFFTMISIVSVTPSIFADHPIVTIETALQSGMPGCENTDDGCYIPSIVVVDVGGDVIMSNTDNGSMHTFTAGTVENSVGMPSGIFDSGILSPGDSFNYSPDVAGEIPYYCMLHTWMQGTIIVQGEEESHIEVVEEISEPVIIMATVVEPDQMMAEIITDDGIANEVMTIDLTLTDLEGNGIEHITYIIKAEQGSNTILEEEGHMHKGTLTNNHVTSALSVDASDEMPVVITVESVGFGHNEQYVEFSEEIAVKQVVPEFGTIAMMILAVAIISIVAVTAKSRVVPRF
ncbi:MAG: PEFG-CTERM domain-containing protein [Thaumarchaeota archaeon]|nr:MAG: PEFG-CTERM domain-containing protein [Nitrososphaerota archaeon]